MSEIRIVRNEAGNCINFYGASNPTYWNACLSGEVDTDKPDTINVINDIITAQTGVTQYEFYRIPYTDFTDADGNSFNTAQEAADYITEKANVIGLSGDGVDLTGVTVCFSLDATNTSIMLDNGYAFGVNTIKAIPNADGTIHIVSNDGADNITHFHHLDAGNTCINGATVGGGLNDVVNALNELFTVGAFEAVVISDPYSTMVADVDGVDIVSPTYVGNSIDPVGADVFGSSASGNLNGYLSTEIIDQAGEYFTFDIRVEGTIGMGLVHSQDSYDNGYYSGNATYADPTTFGTVNSQHSGFQFSHWFHPTPNGSWTNYGANTSYSMRAGWSNFNGTDEQADWLAGNPIKVRVGLDANGFISIETLRDGTDWVVHARTSYPSVEGVEYRLGIKMGDTNVRLHTLPKVHHLAATVTPPTTLGDQSITVFEDNTGDITGTLASGIQFAGTDDGNDNDGFVTTETISDIGDYFQFEWAGGLGDANVGLFSHQDHNVADLQADRTDWSNDDYIYFGARTESNGELNNVYYENGTHATLASAGGNGYGRVGFDEQGRATLWYSADGVIWTEYRRLNQSAPTGTYSFIFVAQGGGELSGLTKGTMTFAPTMQFRYIESPDNNYHYPIFATEEEANYYDLQNGGAGTSSVNVFPDEPTFSQWYIPTNGYTNNGTSAPTGAILFEGNPINWTEITSLTNADLVPSAFADQTVTVNELSAVNIQVTPADASYTTTITDNDSSGLTLIGANVEGTAPEVTGDNVANPSDTYTITITHTNSYGSSTGTLTIIVNNLTAPVTAISGFNHITGTTAMIDADTMDDGSVVHVNNTVADGERFVIEKAYVETNILPSLNAANDMYIIGLENTGSDFSTLELSDFDTAIVWEYETASSHTFKFYRDGSVVQNIVVNSMTQAFYDYAIEVNGTSAWLIACNVNSIMNEPSPADGGVFSNTYEATSIEDTAPVTIHMAALNTTGDISTTDLTTLTTPSAPTSLTNWTKALDFSGSNEHAVQVSTSIYSTPLNMGGINTQVSAPTTSGNTSSSVSARPWATAIVFKYDGNATNQHIWNSGEGAGSTDDNIYLRLDASGYLYFGWGRDGALNECRFIYLGTSINTNHWHGIYIAHNGTRWGGTTATAQNLADSFDIRWFTTNYTGGVFGSWMDNKSTAANWTAGSTGGRMDRQFTGNMTIGGRANNRSFHGKVASMVVTALRVGQPMPDNTEIELMMNDPKQWLEDYRVGQTVRNAHSYTNSSWGGSGVLASGYGNTQMWLMGDGTNDSYANGIRNEVAPNDQNYTKLQLNSMVSNDIENVSIAGLS